MAFSRECSTNNYAGNNNTYVQSVQNQLYHSNGSRALTNRDAGEGTNAFHSPL